MREVTEFRAKYKNFLKWTKYMKESMKKVDIEKFRTKWLPKFMRDVCEPFDKAFLALSEDEREQFFPRDTTIEGVKERRVRAVEDDYNKSLENVPF